MSADFNHFGKIAGALTPICSQIVTKTAKGVVGRYTATAPRKTGHMASSAYYVTSKESTFIADERDFPEVQHPSDDTTAYAAVGAKYGVFPELGTSHQAAQPAWYPAVEATRPEFEAELSTLEEKLRAVI